MSYDRESQARRTKKYHAAHPEKRPLWSRAYYEAHREEIAARVKARLLTQPDKRGARNAYLKAYRAAHREAIAARQKAYQEANRDRVRANALAYHRRKKQNGAVFTPSEWQALRTWFGNVCLCCGTSGKIGADHVVPVSKGGSNAIANLQPLCKPCNSAKGNKIIDYRDPVRLAAFLASL
ncbi:MAG: HNH endonuclease [Betaproteobacteria bacterium]